MDEFNIKTGSKPLLSEEPSPRTRARQSQLVHVVFETRTGAFYSFPDLTQETFNELLQQLDIRAEQIIARNISGSMLILPLRILQRVSLLEIREELEAHATAPHGGMSEIWSLT